MGMIYQLCNMSKNYYTKDLVGDELHCTAEYWMLNGCISIKYQPQLVEVSDQACGSGSLLLFTNYLKNLGFTHTHTHTHTCARTHTHTHTHRNLQ